MITGKNLFEQYRLESGMDDDDVKAARWYKDGLIDFADWLLSQNSSKPIVSGSCAYTEVDMCNFADWYRNGLTNLEYASSTVEEQLFAWRNLR